MRTYPEFRADGSLRYFEVSSAWLVFGPLLRILRSVPGVSQVRRRWFNDDRVTFEYLGIPAVVHEDYGDSSRYWVGLRDPESSPQVDISPIHEAFRRYRGFLIVTLWPFGDCG
jgi:hypothetical protein